VTANLFKEGNSFVHKADPRIKLFLLVFITLSFFLADSIPVTGMYLLFILVLIAASCGIGTIPKAIKPILPLLVFVAVLTPPFHGGGETYLKIHSVVLLSENGIRETVWLIIRFTGITSLFFLFFRTTSIDDLILALRWMRVPYNATLVITIALRYIPHIVHIYGNVTDAHKLRSSSNTKSESRGIRQRIRKLFPVLVSVLIQSVKTIPTLAMTLELKGLGSDKKRSQYRKITVRMNIPLQLATASAIVLAVTATLLT